MCRELLNQVFGKIGEGVMFRDRGFEIHQNKFRNRGQNHYFFSTALRPVPMVFLVLPRLVRELVFVRCPREGSPLM